MIQYSQSLATWHTQPRTCPSTELTFMVVDGCGAEAAPTSAKHDHTGFHGWRYNHTEYSKIHTSKELLSFDTSEDRLSLKGGVS